MRKSIQWCTGLLATAMLLIHLPVPAKAGDKSSPSNIDVSYSVQANKTQNSRKHRVRLTGDGHDRVLCSVAGVPGKTYRVFVFTMDSRLVTQTAMHSGQTTALNNLSKGNYLFDVLVDDEHIQCGHLTIK